MRHIRSLVFLSSLAAVAAGLGGCASRRHMNPDHGISTREWRARQRVHSTAATGKPGGLDSEEAALIHVRYRQTIGGTGTATRDPSSRVLILDEDGGNRRVSSPRTPSK